MGITDDHEGKNGEPATIREILCLVNQAQLAGAAAAGVLVARAVVLACPEVGDWLPAFLAQKVVSGELPVLGRSRRDGTRKDGAMDVVIQFGMLRFRGKVFDDPGAYFGAICRRLCRQHGIEFGTRRKRIG